MKKERTHSEEESQPAREDRDTVATEFTAVHIEQLKQVHQHARQTFSSTVTGFIFFVGFNGTFATLLTRESLMPFSATGWVGLVVVILCIVFAVGGIVIAFRFKRCVDQTEKYDKGEQQLLAKLGGMPVLPTKHHRRAYEAFGIISLGVSAIWVVIGVIAVAIWFSIPTDNRIAMDYHIYRLHKNSVELQRINPPCEDWTAVRDRLKERGRSKNEQLVVMHDGQIYAIERSEGDGFAMVNQSRQDDEDQFWYPRSKQE